MLLKKGDCFWYKVSIAIAFNSQSLYHLALTTYTPSSSTLNLYFSHTFRVFSSDSFTSQVILSISQEYNGDIVYSTFQFLNAKLGEIFNA